MEYTRHTRREYIAERLHSDWGWQDWTKGPAGLSYRDIAQRVYVAFGRSARKPSPATIKNDIDFLRKQAELPSDEELEEAVHLLRPEFFPQWRAKLFDDPTTGKPFVTPKFQHAIFWIMYAVAKKVAIPQWVIDYINEVVPKDEYKLPEDINERLIAGDRLISFLLLLAPRHGKTELVIHTMMFLVAETRTIRILYGNGIKETSELMVDNIKNIFTVNEDIIDLYGNFEPPDKGYSWSKKGLRVAGSNPSAKALTIKPFGISSTVRSLDADAIFADDLQDTDRAESETTTGRDYRWLTGELMTRREPHTGFVYVGSHLPIDTGDLFSWVEDKRDDLSTGNHDIFIVKIPAHDYTKCNITEDPNHEQCVLWPELRPYWFLEALRAALDDDTMFEAVYNQVPKSEAMKHFPKAILRQQFYLPPKDEESGVRPALTKEQKGDELVNVGALDFTRSWREDQIICCKNTEVLVAMGFDPAGGESASASHSAAAVLGACPWCQRRYLIDWWEERVSPETHPATIGKFLRAFRRITKLRVEINAYQKALARDPRLAEIVEVNRVEIDEWQTDDRKWDPRLGIPQLGGRFKNGLFSIPYAGPGDREYAESVIKEFIRWPKKPNDLVMAVWLADLSLMEMLEEYRHIDAEIMPGADKWTTDAHRDQTFEIDLSDDAFVPSEEYGDWW